MSHQQNIPLADQLDDSGSTDLISRRSQLTTMVMVFVLTTVYAVVRYNFFGDVSTDNIPTYILNKSISVSSVVFLLLCSWQHAQGNKQVAKFWGTSSLHFAMLHIAISVVLLSESYFPKLYSPGVMNLNGETCILFGVLAGYFLCAPEHPWPPPPLSAAKEPGCGSNHPARFFHGLLQLVQYQ